MSAYPQPTPGYLRGNAELGRAGRAPLQPAQGHVEHRHPGHRQAAHLGAALRGLLFRISAVRPGIRRHRKVLQPAEPDQLRLLDLDDQPSLVNEARATFSLDDVYIPVNTALSGFNRVSSGSTTRTCSRGKDIPGKIPTVNVPNFYGLAGGPYPSHSSGPIWTGADSLTKVWRTHTFKAGF